MSTQPGYVVTTSHGIAECAVCERAADWAVTQVAVIGTAVGFDRIMEPPGIYHKATARFTTERSL